MKPFVLKKNDVEVSKIRELRAEELLAVNGACNPEPTLPAETITGYRDGSPATWDDGDE
jgi:hypothetical protein